VSGRRRVVLAAVLATLVAAGVRVSLLAGGRDLLPDGVVDIEIARDLGAGRWREAVRRRFHPLDGALIALTARALGREPDETCGLVVALVAGSLVPFLVALTAARLMTVEPELPPPLAGEGRGGGQPLAAPTTPTPALPHFVGEGDGPLSPSSAALAAGLLAACHPYLARASATVYAYPLAHAALALALLAAVHAVTGGLGWCLVAGVACGLGYLARPDGLVLLAGVTAGLALAGSRARPRTGHVLAPALVLLGFAAIASPYLLALHDVSGEWRLTLKKDEGHLVGRVDPTVHERTEPAANDVGALIDRVERESRSSPASPPTPAAGDSLVYALRKTADAIHPELLLLAALGLFATRRLRLAHAPALATLAFFVLAHTLLKKNEGYLSRAHAAGEAALAATWAGLGAATLFQERKRAALLLVLLVAVLLPKTLEDRDKVKNDAEREAAGWIHRHAPPGRELVVCGRDAVPLAFLAGARAIGLPPGDAVTAVAAARALGASFLAVYVRTHASAVVKEDPLAPLLSELAHGGLGVPEAFSGERPNPEGGSIRYTWLVYVIPESPRK
jgi:hypothetical protein